MFEEIIRFCRTALLNRGTGRGRGVFALVASILMLVSGAALAGNVTVQTEKGMDNTTALEAAAETPFGFSNGSFIVAPIPLKSPMFGTGLILGAGYLFQTDEDASSSFLGIAGMKTSNGTRGYGFGGRWYSAGNRWNATLFAGDIDAFYDAYIIGIPVPIQQKGKLLSVAGAYGFDKHISAGLKVDYLDTQILGDGAILPPALGLDANLKLLNVALTFAIDYRDDSFYPTQGMHLNVSLGHGQAIEGFSRDYQKALATFDYYISGIGPGVIAARVAGCSVSDDTPFFEKCSLGGSDAFRGYDSFETLGNALLSAQIAYRGRLGDRFGYSVFGGIGNTGTSFDTLNSSSVRYAAGVGLRYRLSKKFPMDIAFDAVRNRDGQNYSYIYVGQRF